jgi:hypothetical protein
MPNTHFNTSKFRTLVPINRPDLWQLLAESFNNRSLKINYSPDPTMAMDEALAEPPEPPRELEEARQAMTQILRRYPDLGICGFDEDSPGGNDALMLEPVALLMFSRSREWLNQRRVAPGRRGISESAYHLKHVASRDIGYSTSGPLIAAALAEGFRVRRDRRLNAVITIGRNS